MTDQAIRPDSFFKGLPSLAKNIEAKNKGAGEEEQQIYSMSLTHGWAMLREFIERLSEDLDNKQKEAINTGMSYEEIGKNAIVIGLTKDLLKRVLDKVDDATEACTKNEK